MFSFLVCVWSPFLLDIWPALRTMPNWQLRNNTMIIHRSVETVPPEHNASTLSREYEFQWFSKLKDTSQGGVANTCEPWIVNLKDWGAEDRGTTGDCFNVDICLDMMANQWWNGGINGMLAGGGGLWPSGLDVVTLFCAAYSPALRTMASTTQCHDSSSKCWDSVTWAESINIICWVWL